MLAAGPKMSALRSVCVVASAPEAALSSLPGWKTTFWAPEEAPLDGVPVAGASPAVLRSLRLYQRLAAGGFDAVLFCDRPADAFLSIRAKRTGLAFGNTRLAVADETAAAGDFATRYCLERADARVSPGAGAARVARALDFARGRVAASRAAAPPPKVSVCVAHYNHGRYLPQLLGSLRANDYPGLEVVVVDDGSTSRASRAAFDVQARAHARLGWKFIAKAKNEGPGAARNLAVSRSSGELLIFMDSDNLAMPTMVADFAAAMRASGADCLTCSFHAFRGRAPGHAPPLYGTCPLGPCLESGVLENVFGDTNFCIRREAFRRAGGWSRDVRGHADWEFLARLALKGFDLDVVPKPLFWYRHLERSLSRTTERARNHAGVLRAYARGEPARIEPILAGLVSRIGRLHAQNEETGRWAKGLESQCESVGRWAKEGEARNAELEGELARVRAKSAEVGEWAKGVEARNAGLEGEISLVRAKSAEVGEWAKSVEARSAGLEGELSLVRAKNAEVGEWAKGLEARNAELEGELARARAKSAEVGEWAKGVEAHFASLEADLRKVRERNAEVGKWAKGVEIRNEELEQRQSALVRANTRLGLERKAFREETISLKRTLARPTFVAAARLAAVLARYPGPRERLLSLIRLFWPGFGRA